MNILVTGSNGFIGDHVSKYLKGRGHYVIGLGRKEKAFNTDSISEYIKCDIGGTDFEGLKNVFQRIDAVIHLAADMRKEPYLIDVISANCTGTQRLLELCEANGVNVFLQLSSLPVIGKPLYHPITEEHPIHPYTVYHITKRTEELLANYAYEYHGVRTASFRISAPIGTRVNPNTIFPTLIRKAIEGDDLILMGNGTRKQNYLYVYDIARCLELSLTAENVHGVYNLTSNLLLSNYELAEKVIATMNSKSSIVLRGEDPMDDYVWDASICRIIEDSGYCPSAILEDIIKEYALWLKEQ